MESLPLSTKDQVHESVGLRTFKIISLEPPDLSKEKTTAQNLKIFLIYLLLPVLGLR